MFRRPWPVGSPGVGGEVGNSSAETGFLGRVPTDITAGREPLTLQVLSWL